MSRRWKVLITLLLFSLTPLLVVTTVSQRGMVRLGETISSMAKHNRTEIATKALQQTAEDYAKLLNRTREVLELSLISLTRDTERLLSDNPKTTPRVYFAEEYDDPGRAPAEMIPSPRHVKVIAGGRFEPIAINFDHQVFWLAPHVRKSAVASDIARLQSLLPQHKQLELKLGNILYWQYVYLLSGIYASYPGHGGYPPGFDPEKRPWFILAKARGELAWQTPYVDATTGQIIMTASAPLHHPDGSFAGVAAIDTLLSEILQVNALSSRWSPAMRSFIVWSAKDPTTGKSGLWAIAHRVQLSQSTGRNSVIEVEQIVSSDVEKLEQFRTGIVSKQSGTLEMDYEGNDSIWAYAYSGADVSLALTVPKREVLAWVEQPRKAVFSLVRKHWLVTGIGSIVVVLVVILTAFWVSSRMIKALMIMARAVERLAEGDFSARMEIQTGDEREMVARAFNEMVPQLEDRVRIRKALELAQEVQQSLLPQESPELSGFDIAAKSIYCDETGGDYFDFFPCGTHPERFGLAVGDVTGHGVAAALLMTTARALIRAFATRPQTLADCTTLVNRMLVADVRESGNFMSLFILLLEPGSRTVRWVRAGHDPALLFDPVAESFEELAGPGLVLGVEESYSYEQFEKAIETPESIILMGTDGIWEAHNAAGEMFGKQRLCETIKSNAEQTAQDIQDAVLQALSDFRGDVAQEDDVSVVVIKVL